MPRPPSRPRPLTDAERWHGTIVDLTTGAPVDPYCLAYVPGEHTPADRSREGWLTAAAAHGHDVTRVHIDPVARANRADRW